MAEFTVLLLLTLNCLSLTRPSFAAAQEDVLHFTSGVSNPAPQPGQPFTLTWEGGVRSEPVYIVLTYLFPFTPNQDTPYGRTDILSNAPNNGSWVYNVPTTISSGRYTFSIGINPLLLSDTTTSFTIENSQTEYVPPYPSSTTPGPSWSYNGCGLIPLPDYTYTGYQAPCAVTTNGRVETIYPIVPASLSSSFYGSEGVFRTDTRLASLVSGPSSTTLPSETAVFNPDFASDIFAQALQCSTSVSPSSASIGENETTRFFLSVECLSASDSTSTNEGVCHSSGYATFSVSETRSVCCPTGWTTTPLLQDLFCYTSAVFPSSLEPGTQITVSDLVFTTAGLVKNNETPARTGDSAAQSPSSTSNSSGARLVQRIVWTHPLMAVVVHCLFVFL